MRCFVFLLITTILSNFSVLAQDAVTALTNNSFSAEKIAKTSDFYGNSKRIRISVPKNESDSLIFFDGECANIFQVIHSAGMKTRFLMDPEKIAKFELRGRSFESHQVQNFNKGVSEHHFFEKFYSSPEVEMFEGHSCNNYQVLTTYFVKLSGSDYLTILDGVTGPHSQPDALVDIQKSRKQESDATMPMSRKGMRAVGAHITRSRSIGLAER